MRKERIVSLVVTAILLLGTVLFVTINKAEGVDRAIVYVGGDGPGNYTSIQAAIDNVSDDDTVFVYSGTYYENVIINKTIDLAGEDKNTTIIDGGGTNTVVFVSSQGVNISDFTIRTSGRGYSGIDVSSSDNNIIRGNIIANNYRGIYINNSSSNTIMDNTITYNHYFGIIISDSSSNNKIYHNNFIKNTCQSYADECNYWDNGYPSGGNFWSDFNGTDIYHGPTQDMVGSDGIGDTPYNITDDGFNTDKYPFIHPLIFMKLFTGWNLITAPSNISWTAETLGQNVSGCSAVTTFNGISQVFMTHLVGTPYDDFPILAGVGYFIFVAMDSVFCIRDVPILSDNVTIEYNWNMIGWYQNYSTTAESVGQNITDCTVVSMFDAVEQTFVTHIVGTPHDDFCIERGRGLFVYIDKKLPRIFNVCDFPDPQDEGRYVNITCDATDNTYVDTVKVNITYPDLTWGNYTMKQIKPIDTYYYNTTYENVGLHSYFIWCNDTEGIANMSTGHAFTINDITPPEITDVMDTPDPQVNGSWVNITCTVIDNAELQTVTINISWEGYPFYDVPMHPGSGNTFYYNISYSLLGQWTYFIYANDTSGNANTSIGYTFTIITDTSPPMITINFAGNASDWGGPYHIPPQENGSLCPHGYYTNDSLQHEDWIYINCTVTDQSTVSAVKLHLWDRTTDTWSNNTSLTPRGGPYYEVITNNLSNHKYSFDIYAKDQHNNEKTICWSKTVLGGTIGRRYVTLNGTTDNMDYKIFYFKNLTYGAVDANNKDRLHHDQGTDGTVNDTGKLEGTLPGETLEALWCAYFVGGGIDDTLCVEDGWELENYHYHVWSSLATEDTHKQLYWVRTRDKFKYGDDCCGYDKTHLSNSTAITNITVPNNPAQDEPPYLYFNDIYRLNSGTVPVTNTTVNTFTDNSIYELSFAIETYAFALEWPCPSLAFNRSMLSYVILNVPDNNTLNNTHGDTDSDGLSDWTEIYSTYTNPFLADTDNDGVNDCYEYDLGMDPNNYTDYPTI